MKVTIWSKDYNTILHENVPLNGDTRIVSFDAEGTLVTPDFSTEMWYGCIPEAYGRKHGIGVDEARRAVAGEYDRIGDGRLEWYDVRYWFQHFDLGDYREAFAHCRAKIRYYDDVETVLDAIGGRYRLVILSASIREFLEHLVKDISHRFELVVSSITDYRELKTPEFYAGMCRRLGISPQEMVHVGDNRQYDYLNAAKAGVRSFHLDRKRVNPDSVGSLTEFSKVLLERAP
ncbi:MAG: HAD family hydrolase [Chloroflexi bacterium]|nr:HAD family hydrolase [Chloroflexota bacterium]